MTPVRYPIDSDSWASVSRNIQKCVLSRVNNAVWTAVELAVERQVWLAGDAVRWEADLA